ncbi:hypothetical protein HZA98_02920 [Candidatus Woesearchaeota archaeon]|nr:hypothetical protein [Candidatus Woesearchaeota archaeon]
MKKFMSTRVWILLVALILGLIVLSPNPWAHGIEIATLDSTSDAAQHGLEVGMILKEFNGVSINSVSDLPLALESLEYSLQNITVKTSTEEVTYPVTNSLGFIVDDNLTILQNSVGLTDKSVLESINGQVFNGSDDFKSYYNTLIPVQTFKFVTDSGTIAYASRETPAITVTEAKKTHLRFGLDFTGGTRVLLKPVSNETITDQDIKNLIDVLSNRLNVYGLSDIKIRSASDWEGNKYVLVELAGVTQDEVKKLISQQGKFEAKIGDDVAFTGGKADIPYVCRDDGSCSGIKSCSQQSGQWICTFDFAITLGQDAAERQAALTQELLIVPGTSGKGGNYLSKPLDLYLDGKLVNSLQISEGLKGTPTTSISISGPGYGSTQDAAIEAATTDMNQLQTILITGSLPFDLEIVKLDTVSPVIGKSFLQNILFVALLSVLAVAIVIFLRYRKFKFVFPVMFTLVCELFLILAFAAFIGWNLDLAGLAGILAAIGTGVDDQIVIVDEAMNPGEQQRNWKDRLKRAFFIIFAAYAATVAAMIPLWNAGAGLLRGFALTTIVGVTIGVFLTRPAFASIIEKLDKD